MLPRILSFLQWQLHSDGEFKRSELVGGLSISDHDPGRVSAQFTLKETECWPSLVEIRLDGLFLKQVFIEKKLKDQPDVLEWPPSKSTSVRRGLKETLFKKKKKHSEKFWSA